MLAIKLKKIGKKHQPSFRLVVTEKRSKLVGRYVEDIGWLDPKSKEFKVNAERANYWIKVGAQPTDTVHNLLVKAGAIKGPKIAVHAKSKKAPAQPVAEAVVSAEAAVESAEEIKEEKTEQAAQETPTE
ncbi:MAG: 30S ribosomal protein S16, partial [Spirochaetia bacterium]